jgi:hypothetical protein
MAAFFLHELDMKLEEADVFYVRFMDTAASTWQLASRLYTSCAASHALMIALCRAPS